MIRIYWAGWYNQGTSDKIWGVLETDNGDYFNFWCRRGAKMKFKKVYTNRYDHKENKGYKSISSKKLEQIYPGFMDEAQQQLAFDLLSGNVRGVGHMYD